MRPENVIKLANALEISGIIMAASVLTSPSFLAIRYIGIIMHSPGTIIVARKIPRSRSRPANCFLEKA